MTAVSVTHQPDGETVQYSPGVYIAPEIQSAWEEWLRAPPKATIELTAAQIWIGVLVSVVLGAGLTLVARHFGHD